MGVGGTRKSAVEKEAGAPGEEVGTAPVRDGGCQRRWMAWSGSGGRARKRRVAGVAGRRAGGG